MLLIAVVVDYFCVHSRWLLKQKPWFSLLSRNRDRKCVFCESVDLRDGNVYSPFGKANSANTHRTEMFILKCVTK